MYIMYINRYAYTNTYTPLPLYTIYIYIIKFFPLEEMYQPTSVSIYHAPLPPAIDEAQG